MDQYGVLLITMVAIGLLLIITYVWFEMRMFRRYGLAEPPEDVKRLQESISSPPVRIDLLPFTPGRELNGRRVYSRAYETNDGRWELSVEIEQDDIVAFQAVLHHRKHSWLGRTVEDWNKYPKIILPGGCGG